MGSQVLCDTISNDIIIKFDCVLVCTNLMLKDICRITDRREEGWDASLGMRYNRDITFKVHNKKLVLH